ncbi:EcoAI/FtnUII family type I restriction enzme subunit R [Novosphingobium bradum]|uniref:EcoAI/FtnUII family type I restriction enzme subunit R n=1 Tax=Novosphingobium bradum TaxID=1737444 RepID=A0ABV7IL05_9SPHN
MNEAETRAELIDPALRKAGWGVVDGSRTRREVIAPGRIMGKAKRAKPLSCDYVLVYRNTRLATIEAKAATKSYTDGVGQAKDYAERLLTRFAFATNGKQIYRMDMETGAEALVDAFPTPQDLWDATFATPNAWRDRFAAVPYETGGGRFEPRYYQHNAIERTLEAIAAGKDRILLTLATGTGKTAIAFQVAWKLFHARWSLSDWKTGGEPTHRPRILFLADRNGLADQAFSSFTAFEDAALARITPGEVRKKGGVPKNASVFFTIFQTFTSGTDADGNPAPYFGDYPSDFFDCIIIDECHRGGARDESEWRSILEYFAPAVQIGLTATPKRTTNTDTYAYFGDPVYTYSLKQGINDGYLTPFKVRQIGTTIDEYVFTADDVVIEGEVEEGKRYTEGDFNRTIEIREREEYRVRTFMSMIDQREKTIVFCASQTHAGIVRDLINQVKTSTNPHYCVRVTAEDGAIGDQWLRTFQDNDKTIPTILTTSQKLSTGVDARNVRNIVLMRPVTSMIEFKQIIGRGTRLFDGKAYFTILDFVKAYEHFNDPEWDGEPMEPEPPKPPRPDPRPDDPGGDPPLPPEEPETPKARLVIKLADGKERTFKHISATTFWGEDGKPVSAQQFIEALFGKLPELFKDEDELRTLWSQPDTRRKLIDGLAERGFAGEQLDAIRTATDAQDSDLFDVLAYIAFLRAPLKRAERAGERRDAILSHYEPRQREFLDFVLGQYVAVGESELDTDKLPELLGLKYGSAADAIAALGSVAEIRATFQGFQSGLYDRLAARPAADRP